jgi:putative hydrolase of the HAD superfamily
LKKYKHLLFDLDHTLWDYDTNAKETLLELFESRGLGAYGYFDEVKFISTFFEVNAKLWRDYNAGVISKYYIRQQRFAVVFQTLGLPEKYFPEHFDRDYVMECPKKSNAIPYAKELLAYLDGKYQMHIITNGFDDAQTLKLENSGFAKYFDKIVTSESCGAKKPSKQIFDYTLKLISANNTECIMIGDNLQADILGAKNANIDQVYFNPLSVPHAEEITIEIKSLAELQAHL